MTNGFALNHDKNLQMYFFCEMRQARKKKKKKKKKKKLSESCRKHSRLSNMHTVKILTRLYKHEG